MTHRTIYDSDLAMTMDVEAEIRDLKRRVGEIEGSFGFLTEQVKGVHKAVLAFQARTEQRFDQVDGKLDKIDGRLDRVESGLKGLRTDMPKIVGETMREVLREQREKS
jgi:uncharacterized protein YoxC